MADLSVTPIAAQIKPVPNMSLGEMMNLARGAQAYQQSEQMNPLLLQQQRQVVGTGEIALSLEQQKERERNAITEFLKNPANFQTEGRVDINKLNEQIPRIAPLTGSDWMQKYTTLGNAQTQAVQAAQALTQTQREMIASRLAIMGRLGADRPAMLMELEQLKKENPNNRELHSLTDAYKTTLETLPENTNFAQLAITGASSLLNPVQQLEAFGPKAGTISTNAATFPTTTTASPAGLPPVQTVGQQPLAVTQLGPGQTETFSGQYDQNNMPIVNVYSPTGRFLGQRTAGETPGAGQLPGAVMPTPTGGMGAQPVAPIPPGAVAAPMVRPNIQAQPLPPQGQPQPGYAAPPMVGGTTPVARIRAGETPQTVEAANAIRMGAANAAAQVPNQTFNNNEIVKLADEALTGRGAGTLANLTGGYAVFNAVGLGGGNATALNQLGHYMSLQTASLAQSAGLGTDAARNIAAESTGTINWTPDAIKKTARVNRSLATATDLFNQGVQSAFDRSKDPLSARDFQSKWSQTVDINAVRLFDAMKNNDRDAIREVVTAAGGPNSPGYKRLVDNIGAMQKLIKGQ